MDGAVPYTMKGMIDIRVQLLHPQLLLCACLQLLRLGDRIPKPAIIGK
ncbi:hypothetical protein SPLC1_S510670 [Arthrospira platensis C1]|uniref:Uncharacterized protein n=1 Tax=Limnospira indica PCC 8005 TaxID=376219 RepID=A0A9P1KHT6_9CYAN|nr:hypothetical protein SPLC1_S510670 [Arthrospira platensis C1]CDM95724.1 hypothetical protein ARTHRO_40130 [Limnospira indica PCC 8005]